MPRDWGMNTVGRRWLAALACSVALLSAGPTAAAPRYMSYFGLGWNVPEAQDHVNLYWAVSWGWDVDEVLSQLADAKGRGMQAIVHTEFALFDGSGPYANACPYALKADAAARWDSFAQALSERGLLDTVAAFYPVDEPDYCGLSSGDTLTVLDIIRAHPLTSGKPAAVIFTCDIAEKYGGLYRISGGHRYGDALRAYDWVGVDCYGVNDIFTDPAWYRIEFDTHCFCFRSIPGPSYYDNLKTQLNLPAQRLILVPQGFIAADDYGLPDDPQRFATQAAADPSVILMAPFTWFDMPVYPGVRSQPALAQQWRDIGRSIAMGNPPNATPALPAAVPPRLRVNASDVRHFSVYDLNCNGSDREPCAVELHWRAADANAGTQLFLLQGAAAPALVACSPATGYVDIPWILAGVNYTFELYNIDGCATTVPTGSMPTASVNLSLGPPETGNVTPAPNYQGLWWNSPAGSESGWGIGFAHQGDTIFATWFTYGLDGQPLWLATSARLTAPGVYTGDLFTTTGPAFDAVPFNPAGVVETTVGTATFAFTDDNHATFAYTVNPGVPGKAVVAQTKALTRQAFGPMPDCVWGERPDLALATNYQDLWWSASPTSESGWGINFTHQGNSIFATWYTYDGNGKPWWLAFLAGRTVPGVYAGTIFTTNGPPFNAVPFDPADVVETTVGTATLTFADGNNASFAYTVNGVSQTKSITRQVFAAPGTVCQ